VRARGHGREGTLTSLWSVVGDVRSSDAFFSSLHHKTGSAAAGAVVGGWAVAVALSSDQQRRLRGDATTSARDGGGGDDGDGATCGGVSTYVSALLRGALSFATAAAKNTTPATQSPPPLMPSVLASIGNTPMMRIASLSDATGCDILIKCE
jgi:hypothetical protein